METTASAKLTPLQLITRCNRGYGLGFALDRWGEFGHHGRGLRFTPTGMTRLGQAFGYIYGLDRVVATLEDWGTNSAGRVTRLRHTVDGMAEDLFQHLDNLALFGGWADQKHRVPGHLVELRDDGTFLGWSLAWYSAMNLAHQDAATRAKILNDAHTYREHGGTSFSLQPFNTDDFYVYRYSFNGGLLFSGPGADEIFSVNLSPVRYWSIHT